VIRLSLGAAAALLVLVIAAAPSSACGCGIALQATVPTERALIITGGGQEQLIVSFDVLSKGPHGAVVLPVPATPRVDAVHGDLFGYLEKATAPPVAAGSAPSGGAGAGASAPRIVVVSNRRIGGYQVAVLGAGSQAGALSAWLAQHQYELPSGARPIIASYLKQGWSFVAVRLAKRASGSLAPLRIRFASKRAIYPMRLEQLGHEPVTVNLYLVGEHPQAVSQLSLVHVGRVRSLHPAVPAQLRRYLGGTWITRVDGDDLQPSTLTRDFVAQPIPNAGVGARVATATAGGTEPRWWVWLLLGAGVAIVAAYAARAIRRPR
jgi:Uncharacterized protein conserved in bacteria (DUF2330)